jgi:hypothetical protein
MQKIGAGHYTTDDRRFEVKHDEATCRWILTANDEEAEAALRSTAHLRPYARLSDAESWIFAAVYPHLHGEPPKEAAARGR